MSQVKNISKKYKVDVNDSRIIGLKNALGNNMGYFSKMAQWVFEDGTEIEEIKENLNLLKSVKISKSINSFKKSEDLYDFISETQNKRKVNQILKSIPSNSRKNVSSRIKSLISNNVDQEELFKDFFSKKGGTCKTEDILYQRVSEMVNISKGGSSYKSILRKINSKLRKDKFLNFFRSKKNKRSKGDIVYKDGKTIIVRVNSYSLSKEIGSNRWCISTSKSHWKNYNDDDKETAQYFIYQTEFDPSHRESMVGATVKVNGDITAAHYRNDNNCDSSYLYKYKRYLLGKDVTIETIQDLIKYNVSDYNMILKICSWSDILSESNFKSTIINTFDQYDNGNYFKYSSTTSIFSNFIKNIYKNMMNDIKHIDKSILIDFYDTLCNYRMFHDLLFKCSEYLSEDDVKNSKKVYNAYTFSLIFKFLKNEEIYSNRDRDQIYKNKLSSIKKYYFDFGKGLYVHDLFHHKGIRKVTQTEIDLYEEQKKEILEDYNIKSLLNEGYVKYLMKSIAGIYKNNESFKTKWEGRTDESKFKFIKGIVDKQEEERYKLMGYSNQERGRSYRDYKYDPYDNGYFSEIS